MKNNTQQFESGQTLIETIVALFVLVMGITAAVGLAVYAFGASTSVTKQIVGAGLAREAIEAVKNMRDTNWMLSAPIDTTCYNFENPGVNNASCYIDWLKDSGVPDANSSAVRSSDVGFDIQANPGFNIQIDPEGGNRFWRIHWPDYGMNLNTNPADANFSGYYTPNAAANSSFYRKIIISTDFTSPMYDKNIGPLLIVQAQVWWKDKKCPSVGAASVWSSVPAVCKVEMVAHLTNWKDYQYQ